MNRPLLALLAVALIFAAPVDLATESLKMTTTYPAPSGVYQQMTTTGNSYMARDGGVLSVGTRIPPTANTTKMLVMGGNVGIGMNPASLLSVNGGVQIGDDATPCAPEKSGTMKFAQVGGLGASKLQICDGSAWVQVSDGTNPPNLYVSMFNGLPYGMPNQVSYYFTKGSGAAALTAVSAEGGNCYNVIVDQAWYCLVDTLLPFPLDAIAVTATQDGNTYTW